MGEVRQLGINGQKVKQYLMRTSIPSFHCRLQTDVVGVLFIETLSTKNGFTDELLK